MDARVLIDGAIIAALLIFAATRFAISWIRSSPEERKRWSYGGRHSDGDTSITQTYATWRGRHRDK